MKIYQKTAIVFAALVLSAAFYRTPGINAKTSDNPAFYAYIEYSPQGYIARGAFTEFTPDITHIQPLYSLDGKKYHTCGVEWNLQWLGSEDSAEIAYMSNQTCLYQSQEPLKNYLNGEIDRFYLKLCLTHESGTMLLTKPAIIDRGTLQPLPEELFPIACFPSSMSVRRKTRPFVRYGKYQITVNADTTAEEISAYLPETLPIEIQLQKGNEHFTEGAVDCPVRWKPLSLPSLTSGESITISDAAEEIIVPAGTTLKTPMGIYELKTPLKIQEYGLSDEIELVLNVTVEDGNPSGVLAMENDGLELCFEQKPTGATTIRAYTFSEKETKWTELPELPLLKAIHAQPSCPNSAYTLVLGNNQEPLRSYLTAKEAGDVPTPFIIGLKIEGGVYDGKQLLLTWPDSYDLPLQLPTLGGSGGNENNAGAANKEDGTTDGQRPTLPKTSEKQPDNKSDNKSENTLENTLADSSGYTEQQDKKTQAIDSAGKSIDAILSPIGAQTLLESKAGAQSLLPLPTSAVGTHWQTGSAAVGTSAAKKAEATSLPLRMKQAGSVLLETAPMTDGAGIYVIGIVGLCIIGMGIFVLAIRKKSGHWPDKMSKKT